MTLRTILPSPNPPNNEYLSLEPPDGVYSFLVIALALSFAFYNNLFTYYDCIFNVGLVQYMDNNI